MRQIRPAALLITTRQIVLSVMTANASAGNFSVMTENWPPFNYENEKGEITGYCTEIV